MHIAYSQFAMTFCQNSSPISIQNVNIEIKCSFGNRSMSTFSHIYIRHKFIIFIFFYVNHVEKLFLYILPRFGTKYRASFDSCRCRWTLCFAIYIPTNANKITYSTIPYSILHTLDVLKLYVFSSWCGYIFCFIFRNTLPFVICNLSFAICTANGMIERWWKCWMFSI